MRKKEGYKVIEVVQAIIDVGDIIINKLISLPELNKYIGLVRDSIGLSVQMMVDEIKDTFEAEN